MPPIKVFVTGASGFVGEALVYRLLQQKDRLTIAGVRGKSRLKGSCPLVHFDLASTEDLPLLGDVDVIVHAAARVHVMKEASDDPLTAFRAINVDGTLRLARHAAESGVKRFIFVSSIKVNGDSTELNRPFTADDIPAPTDPYGVSKHEAEEGLKNISVETGMDVVIIRPPLVYGPGVKANFLSMLRLLDRGVPMPFGSLANRRSLIALPNLVDLLAICVDHPEARNQTFLASDGEDLSTPMLLKRLAHALGKKARLISVPGWLLLGVARLTGKQAVAHRVCGSLQVDIAKTRRQLGWIPPVSVEQALNQTASDYLEKHRT